MARVFKFTAVLAIAIVLAVSSSPTIWAQAQATNDISVNTLDAAKNGADGKCSLSEALENSALNNQTNADCAAGSLDKTDKIILPAGEIKLTANLYAKMPTTADLSPDVLPITGSVIIQGDPSSRTVINGNKDPNLSPSDPDSLNYFSNQSITLDSLDLINTGFNNSFKFGAGEKLFVNKVNFRHNSMPLALSSGLNYYQAGGPTDLVRMMTEGSLSVKDSNLEDNLIGMLIGTAGKVEIDNSKINTNFNKFSRADQTEVVTAKAVGIFVDKIAVSMDIDSSEVVGNINSGSGDNLQATSAGLGFIEKVQALVISNSTIAENIVKPTGKGLGEISTSNGSVQNVFSAGVLYVPKGLSLDFAINNSTIYGNSIDLSEWQAKYSQMMGDITVYANSGLLATGGKYKFVDGHPVGSEQEFDKTELTNSTLGGNSISFDFSSAPEDASYSMCAISMATKSNLMNNLFIENSLNGKTGSLLCEFKSQVGSSFSQIFDSPEITSLGGNVSDSTLAGSLVNAKDVISDTAISPTLAKSLEYNGGPTRTLAINTSTIGYNAGIEADNLPAYDQRGEGYPRISHGAPDVGAFEYLASKDNEEPGSGSGGGVKPPKAGVIAIIAVIAGTIIISGLVYILLWLIRSSSSKKSER